MPGLPLNALLKDINRVFSKTTPSIRIDCQRETSARAPAAPFKLSASLALSLQRNLCLRGTSVRGVLGKFGGGLLGDLIIISEGWIVSECP